MAYSPGTVTPLARLSSPTKEVYIAKDFIPHAELLDQAFAHCPKFPTAASRRSEARVAVPPCPSGLSARVPVIALVGRYPANKLMGRKPLPERPLRASHPQAMPTR